MTRRPVQELALIRGIRSRAGRGQGVRVGIGDDCAILEPESGAALLATTDLLIEDVHFRRAYATPTDIGWKALAVNLSDIASMGGRPALGPGRPGLPGFHGDRGGRGLLRGGLEPGR